MAAPPSAEEIDARWDFTRPDESERRFRVLLDQVGANTAAGAEVLTQIARTQGLRQQFEDAHGTLDTVERLLGPHASRLRARYLLERGRVLNSSGNQTAALPLFAHALGVALAAGEDFDAIDARAHDGHRLARRRSARLEPARAGVDRREPSSARPAMARITVQQSRVGAPRPREFDAALRCFEEALRAREAQGDEALVRIARWCVARGLRSVGRVDEALAIQQALLAEHRRLGADAREISEELIACLEALGRDDEAQTARRESGSVASGAADDSR